MKCVSIPKYLIAMRYVFFGTFFLIFLSCGQEQQSQVEEIDQSGLNYPPGAIIEDYQELEGLSKVSVKESGRILAEGDYYQGKRQGSWTEFYANGLVKGTTTYYNGIKQGVAIELSEIGELTKKAVYRNGLLDGEYVLFERRKIKEILNYSNGLLNGPKRSYYTNGNPLEESNYVNGKIDGVAKYYNQQGELLYEYQYKQGELVED